MKYIIRFDDICPQMDFDTFWRLVKVCQKYSVSAVLCVIPSNRHFKGINQDKIFRMTVDHLLNLGWELAQHGYTHELNQQSGGMLNISYRGEFPGLPADKQYDIIKLGKDFITDELGWDVTYFAAPSHSFDHSTIESLKKLGFKAMLDGVGLYPYHYQGLYHIPLVWWRCKPMPFPISRLNGVTQICLHPNTMRPDEVTQFETFIRSHHDSITTVASTIAHYRPRKSHPLINRLFTRLFYLKLGGCVKVGTQ